MNANSRSEAVWEVLHHAKALLVNDGYADPLPPLSVQAAESSEGYNDLAARYGEHLEFGTGWPTGSGSPRPQALVLCSGTLSTEAQAFVRSWFENSRVNLPFSDNFYLQPLPIFSEAKHNLAFGRDLCTMLQPKVVLSLGAEPAQKLLGAPLSLETLQGSDFRFDRWSVVTTMDPENFAPLGDSEKNKMKAQVWRDLQRLLGKLKYG